ncbi:probable isoleucine--tRNA ligase, cytoplasmic [Schistocerca gregaria]|uniref:probable isoleucine--tRNA ligase, cytoplasmic n=1 Tax=Schistocerca gregaria TaxID=7010 RepID=UPI00211DDAEB|nr:probable isoleucine--tRNA ligase, cytoplasmic [Schistocerca gregaria]XP_049852255.1 probable isoleucine--tRNA ligase, cytoplasmic [Schistocerca gregaria]
MEQVPEYRDFPGSESKVLDFWNRIDAFQKSMKMSEGRPAYSFYDGPPFATGLPHYGHILAGTIKDIVTRYAHLRGFHVERRFGWDCHGLPIEFEINKELGIKTKKQVLEYGIGNYNKACRNIVMRYAGEWEKIVKRLGRWIDFENDYKTMDLSYMETIWWVFGELWKKGLIYQGYKVMPYSVGCTTPLSNFEAGLSYKNVEDPSIIISFAVRDDPEVRLLAWTTTPWTLPSNLGLCVHPEFTYWKIRMKATGEQYIICDSCVCNLTKNAEEYEVVKSWVGRELVGTRYEPMFDYFVSEFPNAFRVVCDPYVTNQVGTGIVHMAPAFGEDDCRVCVREKICEVNRYPCPLDDDACFTSKVSDFESMYIKDADKLIMETLKKRRILVKRGTVRHQYPFCWRSDTPIIYRPVPSWFVKVTAIKERLLQNNAKTYWMPEFVKEKRFHNWLADARDWAISRNRFWGTPIPLWVSDDNEEVVQVSSLEELERLSGKRLTDIHREYVDEVLIPSKMGKGMLRRIPEVFDCWFESGSMPYAQQHYPFENQEKFLSSFPANFVAEGVDQTRGWFYTLMVISTGLFDKPAFQNLIVNGLVLASDGKKMSKRLKNYPDASLIVNRYGADALRLYLINSPVVRADQLRFREEGVASVIRDVFLRWYNSYRFLVQSAFNYEHRGRKFVYDRAVGKKTRNVMDRWALSSMNTLIKFIHEEMKRYRLYTVVPRLVKFIESLANDYVRFNRGRLRGNEGEEECECALSTLASILLTLCSVMAPFTPFFVEDVYQNLSRLLPESEESVHFTSYPEVDESLFDAEIERKVSRMLCVVELARRARDRAVLPLRQPLRKLVVLHADDAYLQDVGSLKSYVLSEASVRELELRNDSTVDVRWSLQLVNDRVGSRLRGDKSRVQAELSAYDNEKILAFQEQKKVCILGHDIFLDDVTISRSLVDDGQKRYFCYGDDGVAIILDPTIDEEAVHGRIVREFTNRIQRLRKHAKLVHADHIIAFYSWSRSNPETPDLDRILNEHRDVIESTTHTMVVSEKFRRGHYVVIDKATTDLTEEIEVAIVLCRPDLYVDVDRIVASGLADRATAERLELFVASVGGEATRRQLVDSKVLALNLDGRSVDLVYQDHVYENARERANEEGFPYLAPRARASGSTT